MKKIERLIKYYLFNESVKQMEVKKIMDKVSKKKPLTKREKNFLELYQATQKEELKDFLYLSKNSTFSRGNTSSSFPISFNPSQSPISSTPQLRQSPMHS